MRISDCGLMKDVLYSIRIPHSAFRNPQSSSGLAFVGVAGAFEEFAAVDDEV
jgi:hypothetical protein